MIFVCVCVCLYVCFCFVFIETAYELLLQISKLNYNTEKSRHAQLCIPPVPGNATGLIFLVMSAFV